MHFSASPRDSVLLGFKAFDLHELMLHFIATRLDLYSRFNLEVQLRDITFTPDDSLPSNLFSAACGSALSAQLKGFPRRIVLVGVDRPLFWLFARPEISTLSELVGERIATYPAAAPPAQFLRMVLRQKGFDPDRDFQLEATRDDVCRLGMLRLKEAAAALLSTAVCRAEVLEAGFNELLFLGEQIHLPTTGLAVDLNLIRKNPDLVGRMAHTFQESLRIFHAEPEVVTGIISDVTGQSVPHSRVCYETIQPNFTVEGRGQAELYQPSLNGLARELKQAAVIDINEILQFSSSRE